MRVPLFEKGFVTLDGSGNGTAKVGPLSSRETWYPGNAAVSVLTSNNQASCKVYAGLDTTQNNFRDETPNGSTGDNTGAIGQDTIRCGAYIWAVWSGGDPGAQAVLAVTGTKDV